MGREHGIPSRASGLPVIIDNVGGIADIVEHGVIGYLIIPGDNPPLEMALDTLLSSQTLQCEMGAAARDQVVSLFDSRRAFERITVIRVLIAEEQLPHNRFVIGPSASLIAFSLHTRGSSRRNVMPARLDPQERVGDGSASTCGGRL